jgi:hypothetical protein
VLEGPEEADEKKNEARELRRQGQQLRDSRRTTARLEGNLLKAEHDHREDDCVLLPWS